MSKETIDQMWEKFAEHQPEADRLGYGPEWKRMCEQRTVNTTAGTANLAARSAARAAYVAWAAADLAADAEADAEYARCLVELWAKQAIDYINQAEGKS